MSTVVYLSNQTMQVVVGSIVNTSIEVRSSYILTTPEGSTINGMIIDAQAFSDFLKKEWESKGLPSDDVILIANSTKFAGKFIDLPALNKKKTMEYISREYADIGRGEGSIYGYTVVGNGEGTLKRIYAEAIDPELIKDYIDIFENAGIKLTAVYSDESALIKLIEKFASLQRRTFLFIVAEEKFMTLIVWVNGSFFHYNVHRCFHEHGTDEYAQDLGRTISSVMQFMQANQVEFSLEGIYITGPEKEEFKFYKSSLRKMGIVTAVEPYNLEVGSGAVDNALIHCVAGLFKRDKNANYVYLYKQLAKRIEIADESGNRQKYLTIIGGTAAVIIFIFIVSLAVRIVKNVQYNLMVRKVEDPARQMDIARYDMLSSKGDFLDAQLMALDDLKSNIFTYPVGNTEILKVFENCATGIASLEFSSFESNDGYISVSAKASEVEDINQFIKKLTEEEIFKAVDYTGYAYSSEDDTWNIKVSCVLNESAGREIENHEN